MHRNKRASCLTAQRGQNVFDFRERKELSTSCIAISVLINTNSAKRVQNSYTLKHCICCCQPLLTINSDFQLQNVYDGTIDLGSTINQILMILSNYNSKKNIHFPISFQANSGLHLLYKNSCFYIS